MLKDIYGYEGLYAVDMLGNVYSYSKKNKYNPNHNGMYLKKTNDNGYEYVTLHNNGKQKKCAVHRIIAEAFIKNYLNKPHVNHINGVKNDNRVENLEWCTPKENCIHAYKNGLSIVNENVRRISSEKMKMWNSSDIGKEHCRNNGIARRKLSKEQVKQIVDLKKSGKSAYYVARIMPVSKPQILKIYRGEIYKEILNELQ